MEKITFAERLKEARKNAKLTQQDLADIVGRTKSAVSRWESGENTPQLFDLVKIEKAVGVPGDVLMYGTEKLTPTILSEINKTSAMLEEPRQESVLKFAKVQLDRQNFDNSKLINMKHFTREKRKPKYTAVETIERVSAGFGFHYGENDLNLISLQ